MVLAALTAVLGPALTSLPIDVLRLVVGGLLLVFGLQWLRKAILRAAGVKAQHDEERRVRARTVGRGRVGAAATGSTATRSRSRSRACCSRVSRSSFIVLTFGANQQRIGLAAAAAAVAVVLVVIIGVAVHAPLARVPENAMKFAVGVMLTSYGMFWGVEGAGAPGRAGTARCW